MIVQARSEDLQDLSCPYLEVLHHLLGKALTHDLQAVCCLVLVALTHQEVQIRLSQLHVAPDCTQVTCRPLQATTLLMPLP